ncbi:hypothetical protein WJX73_006720 [Symbiochloris irregularis]|uniref:Uncharacterized protein n=1 Tax=Symbiochloris irregularis TaxID=706552 RepID=A0AAW1NT32_9CHLO
MEGLAELPKDASTAQLCALALQAQLQNLWTNNRNNLLGLFDLAEATLHSDDSADPTAEPHPLSLFDLPTVLPEGLLNVDFRGLYLKVTQHALNHELPPLQPLGNDAAFLS